MWLVSRGLRVSIHARHCWRADRCERGDVGTFAHVSIHARHCWRADRTGGAVERRSLAVSIHARHCWRADRRPPGNVNGVCAFQSTPAIAGERTHRLFPGRHFANERFNPRPPLLASGPGDGWVKIEIGDVSIHARHCWRADPFGCHFLCDWQLVSIHARHCWRADPFPRNARLLKHFSGQFRESGDLALCAGKRNKSTC